MAIAAYFDLDIQQFDAVNAFCNAFLDEDVRDPCCSLALAGARSLACLPNHVTKSALGTNIKISIIVCFRFTYKVNIKVLK